MRLERLNKAQTEALFSERLVVDFPEAEIKPLKVILPQVSENGMPPSLTCTPVLK